MRVVGFVLVGLVYGVLLRAWMRFISSEPEFSWAGTSAILIVFTLLGLTVGLTDLARRRGGKRSTLAVRIVGLVLGLGCFMAAGAAMFPTIIPAALGVARRDWWRWVRLLLVVWAIGFGVFVVIDADGHGAVHTAVALVLYAGFCCVETAMFSVLLAPSLPPGSIAGRPRWVRALLVLLPVVVVGLGVLAIVGV